MGVLVQEILKLLPLRRLAHPCAWLGRHVEGSNVLLHWEPLLRQKRAFAINRASHRHHWWPSTASLTHLHRCAKLGRTGFSGLLHWIKPMPTLHSLAQSSACLNQDGHGMALSRSKKYLSGGEVQTGPSLWGDKWGRFGQAQKSLLLIIFSKHVQKYFLWLFSIQNGISLKFITEI